MRAVYSLSTDSFNKWKLEERLLLYKYSMTLAKKYYTVILYTDPFGEEQLKDYADIIVPLNKEKDYLWSEAKLEAIDRETSASLHLDGDLFLYEKLKLPDVDICYDTNELNLFESHYKNTIELFNENKIQQVFKEWNTVFNGSFNIGVLKFRNDNIKSKYIETFRNLKKWFTINLDPEIKNQISTIRASMTLEEYSLTCLAEYYNWSSVELSKTNKYLHKWGSAKYSKEFLKKVQNKLQYETLHTS